ncbi:MAG: zinc finger domain-containing protein [Collinsella sp.]
MVRQGRGRDRKQCSRCHGTGYVTTVSVLGQVQSSSPCPDCHSEGRS